MIIQLPLTSDPAQDFVINLGGQQWELYVRYNDRGSFWTMDITEYNSQTSLVTGMPILLGADLLAPYILNNGAMVATDTNGLGQDAGPDDLGTRVIVFWYSPDEVANAKGHPK
jgi:hypothetical protein